MRTAVVIPNWNGEDFLADCLDALKRQTAKDFGVIVVDNGSIDGSEQIVAGYPGFRLIRLDRNYGFGGGVNRGIEAAMAEGAEFVALLNNDAAPEPDWLAKLEAAMDKQPKAGIVMPKILRWGSKIIDTAGDGYSIWGLPFPRGRDEHDSGQFDQAEEVFSANAGAALYRVRMFEDIGIFDEDFFAYFEDVDISFRARLAGWRVLYEPGAVVYHHVNATSSKLGHFARHHTTKNFVYLYVKNMPGWLFWRYLPTFAGGFAMMSANSLLRGQGWAMLSAWAQILVKTPATLAKRWRIQSRRKVKPADIDRWLYHQIPPTSKIIAKLRGRQA